MTTPRGLVDDDHVLVAERERDLQLRAGLGSGRRALGLFLELDQLAAGEAERLAGTGAVDHDPAALDQPLDRGARSQSGVLGQVAVEPLAGGLLACDQLASHGSPSLRSAGSPRISVTIRSATPVTTKVSARLKFGSSLM